MAEAVANQDTEIIARGPSVFKQVGSLASQVQRIYTQPAFQRSLPTMVAVIVGIVGLAAYVYMQKPDRTTLYAGLPESEKSLVLDISFCYSNVWSYNIYRFYHIYLK